MLDPVLIRFGFNIVMAVKADLPRRADDQVGLIGAMRTMADQAIALGEGGVCGLCLDRTGQVFVAGQAKYTVIQGGDQKAGLFSAMRSMAAGTFTTRKWPVLAEQPFLAHCFFMAAEAQSGHSLRQQCSVW